MEKIWDILEKQLKQNGLGRTVNANDDGENIIKCKSLVDQGYQRFQVSRIHDAIHSMLRPFQLCTAINLHLNRKSFSLDSMLPPPLQPIAPEIFYDRDEYVTEITCFIIHKEQMRIAILGTGGMGRTTVVLHIMHHLDVATKYSSCQYFVGCDAVDSVGTLALLILKTLQIPPFSGENSAEVLHQSLSNALGILIVLDNFETIWNADKNHAAVRDLLQKIASVISMSLIITS